MATIVVVGLRRSGTTALWRSFRQLPGFVGLYEPFNPKLGRPSASDRKDVWADLRALTGDDRATFAGRFAPILPADEASDGLSPDNATYFRWLLDRATSPAVVLSLTRCGFKLPALRPLLGASTVVHISREPVAWIRSHLFPSEQGLSYARQRLLSRIPVLRDRTMPRDYGLDAVVASPAFRQRLGMARVPAASFERMTPAQKLYVLWMLHERAVELDAASAWPGAHMLVSHQQFSAAPEQVVTEALALAGVDVERDAIHRAAAHVREFDPNPPPAGVTRRIQRDVDRLRRDPAVEVALTADLARLHSLSAHAA